MLGVARLWFRRTAAPRWRAWLLLAVLTGVIAGATLGTLSIARRTETAYPRFLRATRAFDLSLPNASFEGQGKLFDTQALLDFPEVEDAAVAHFYPVGRVEINERVLDTAILPIIGSPDGKFGSRINEIVIIEGRAARAIDEVVFPFPAAERFGVEVGDTVRANTLGPQRLAELYETGGNESDGPVDIFRVAGIGAIPNMFPPVRESNGLDLPMLSSPAYARSHGDAFELVILRLRNGRADVDGVLQRIDRLAGGQPVFVFAERDATRVIQRSIGVEATALRLLAIGVAAMGALLIAQALMRQAEREGSDAATLAALGLTRRQVVALGLARDLCVGLAAAAVAVFLALALSALGPVGAAAKAEIDDGLDLNVGLLAAGAAMTLAVVVALGTAASWRAVRRALARGEGVGVRGGWRPVGALGGRVGVPPTVSVGTQMALHVGGGPAAVPVRAALVGAALSVASIVTLVCFTASLQHLFQHPPLYGWNWDVQVGGAFGDDRSADAERLARDPDFTDVALAATGRVEINGRPVDALGVESVTGNITPTVVTGRAPARADEIMLGSRSLAALDVSVGNRVRVGVAGTTRAMRIVGTGLIGEVAGAGIGRGAAMTLAGLKSVGPDTIANALLLRYAPSADPQATLDRLWSEVGENGVYPAAPPGDLADIDRVGSVPSVVAALFAGAAVAVVVHMLASSVRRRRREFAVLKTIGFVRRQVSAAVAWQATTIAAVGLIAGIPLGMVGGRLAWRAFADRLGVAYIPVIPWIAVAIVAGAGIVLANLVALPSARSAGRVSPGPALRTE